MAYPEIRPRLLGEVWSAGRAETGEIAPDAASCSARTRCPTRRSVSRSLDRSSRSGGSSLRHCLRAASPWRRRQRACGWRFPCRRAKAASGSSSAALAPTHCRCASVLVAYPARGRRPQSSHMTPYRLTPAAVTAIWRRTSLCVHELTGPRNLWSGVTSGTSRTAPPTAGRPARARPRPGSVPGS